MASKTRPSFRKQSLSSKLNVDQSLLQIVSGCRYTLVLVIREERNAFESIYREIDRLREL